MERLGVWWSRRVQEIDAPAPPVERWMNHARDVHKERQHASGERHAAQTRADVAGETAASEYALAGRAQRYAEGLAYLAEYPNGAKAAEVTREVEWREAARHAQSEAGADRSFARQMARDVRANTKSVKEGKGVLVTANGASGSYRVHSLAEHPSGPRAYGPPDAKTVTKQPLPEPASTAAVANAPQRAAVEDRPAVFAGELSQTPLKGSHIARPATKRTPRTVPTVSRPSAAAQANTASAKQGKGTVVVATGVPGSHRVHSLAPDRTGARAFVPGAKTPKPALGPQATARTPGNGARLASGFAPLKNAAGLTAAPSQDRASTAAKTLPLGPKVPGRDSSKDYGR